MTQGEVCPVSDLWFEQALLPEGWARDVRIETAGGTISRILTGVKPQAGDALHAAVLPGMPNLHSHAFQRGMAGLAERRGPEGDTFWTWRETMYRFVERLDPDTFESIAAMAFAEMLESGFTRVGEFHYLHRDRDGSAFGDPAEMAVRLAAAAETTGIGLSLLPVFYAHSGFGGAAPKPEQKRFVHDVKGFERLVEASRRAVAQLGDAVVGVAPHSLRAVTPEELSLVAGLAGGGPVHIHVAEQIREVEECFRWSGQRPVGWLLDHLDVGENWCLVHATHIDGEEIAALTRTGAVVGLCPITEANLGDGIFPAPAFVESGGRFGIGSDSNVLIDAAEELRILEYGQRLVHRSRNVTAAEEGSSTGGTLYRAALAGGARALGSDSGNIRAGAPADLVSLDMNHPALSGRKGDALIDSLIFAARGGAIDCVWRRGKMVVERGRHIAREKILERYRRAVDAVIAQV
jgi:formiminoglutamate deiminase